MVLPSRLKRDARPEVGAVAGIRRLDVGLLRHRVAPAREDVDRAGAVGRLVVLVAVDALGAAAFVRRAHRDRVAIVADGRRVAGVAGQRAAAAEVRVFGRVRGLEIGDLLQLPRRPTQATATGDRRTRREAAARPETTAELRADVSCRLPALGQCDGTHATALRRRGCRSAAGAVRLAEVRRA